MARNLEPQEEVPTLPQPDIRNSPLSANRSPTTQAQVRQDEWYTEHGMAPRETGLQLLDGNHRFLAATARTRTTRGIYSMLPLGHTHDTTAEIHELPPRYMPQYVSSE